MDIAAGLRVGGPIRAARLRAIAPGPSPRSPPRARFRNGAPSQLPRLATCRAAVTNGYLYRSHRRELSAQHRWQPGPGAGRLWHSRFDIKLRGLPRTQRTTDVIRLRPAAVRGQGWPRRRVARVASRPKTPSRPESRVALNKTESLNIESCYNQAV